MDAFLKQKENDKIEEAVNRRMQEQGQGTKGGKQKRVETAREKASTRTTATTATGGGTKTSGSSNSSGRRKAKARTPPRTREESSGTSDPEKGQPRRSSSERVYKCT